MKPRERGFGNLGTLGTALRAARFATTSNDSDPK